MEALLKTPVFCRGQCLVRPESIGLVTDTTTALLLLEQPDPNKENEDLCTCHAADYRPTHRESRIIITDSEGEHYVYPVMTSVIEKLLEVGFLYERTDGISCTELQGKTLKPTKRGNAHAAMLRKLPRR